ncbi:hypothetical protein L0152_07275 [bacterium]|nr:hypothetical protein [bacterium]
MDQSTITPAEKKSRILHIKPTFLRVESTNFKPDSAPEIGVDRENAIIRRYVVAQEGLVKSGDHEFDKKTLEQIAGFINAKNAGIKSRFTHPTMSDDGLGKFLGRIKNATIEEISIKPDGSPSIPKKVFAVRADLHLDKTSLDTPPSGGKPLGEYVMDLAESDPDALSSSITTYDWTMEYKTDPETKKRLKGEDGYDLPPLLRLNSLHASDIVDTGNAVDGLLAADGQNSESMLLWKATELADRMFLGQPREVIESRLTAWLNRYLDFRQPKLGESNINQNNLTGGETMPETKEKSEEKITLSKTELEAEFAKRESSLREEIRKENAKENAELKERLDQKDLEVWAGSSAMSRKLRSDQRENACSILLALKNGKETIPYLVANEKKNLSPYDAVKAFMEGLSNILPDTKEIAGHLSNTLSARGNADELFAKYKEQVAKDNPKLAKHEVIARAAILAARENPAAADEEVQ